MTEPLARATRELTPEAEAPPPPRQVPVAACEPGTTRVRVDAGGAPPHLTPGRGSLLKAFGAWGAKLVPKPPGADRRKANRHDVDCHAWVGWKTWRRFHVKDALLVNIGRGGARVFLDAPPPTDRPLWIFLETGASHAVVKARVLDLRATAGGQCVARVAFHTPCPFVFFEAAVCGQHASDPKTRARSRTTPASASVSTPTPAPA